MSSEHSITGVVFGLVGTHGLIKKINLNTTIQEQMMERFSNHINTYIQN